MLEARSNRPIFVTRGSSRHLEQRSATAFVEVLDVTDPALGVDAHRTELRHQERRAVAADAALTEDDGSTVFDLDGDRADRQDRRSHHQYEGGQRDVEQSLDESLAAEESGAVEAEQRVVSHRGRADLAMVDAAEASVDAHVGAGASECEELGCRWPRS